MKFSKTMVFILTLAVVMLLLPAPVQAEKEISITGHFFNGKLLYDSCNRLTAQVINRSSKDFSGTIVLELEGRYVRDVFIEAGKTGTTVFYLPPMAYSQSRYTSTTTTHSLALYDQRGRIVDQTKLVVASESSPQFVGVLSKQPGDFRRISDSFDYLTVAALRPDYLDNLQFAQNFQVIILSNPDSIVLDPQQTANLRTWLESGGILIVGGGSGWQQSAAVLPPDLLPVRVLGVETVSYSTLSPLGLPAIGEGECTLAIAEGNPLLVGANKLLLAEKQVGGGAVLWSALDLESAPLQNPTNLEAFWEKLLLISPKMRIFANTAQAEFISSIFNSISQDRLASALSPGKLFLLLLAYIVLVGPLNWLVLRKLDRREWAWFSIPTLALFLTAGFFVYGRIGRGSDTILYQVNLIEQYSQQHAGVRSLNGVFVPSTKSFSLRPDASTAPLSGAITALSDSGQQVLEFKHPPLWSLQRFYSAGTLALNGGFAVEIVSDDASGMEAVVANNTGYDLFAGYVRIGQEWLEFGPIAAGESKASLGANPPDFKTLAPFLATGNGLGPWYWWDYAELFPASTAFFVGFGNTGPVPVAGISEKQALDIWLVPFTQKIFAPAGSDFEGVFTPTIYGGSKNDYRYDYHFYSYEPANLDFSFTLPDNLDHNQGQYSLYFAPAWGEAEGTLAIYNHKEGRWQDFGNFADILKHPVTFILENPPDFIFRNRLMLRLTYKGDFGINPEEITITVTGGRISD